MFIASNSHFKPLVANEVFTGQSVVIDTDDNVFKVTIQTDVSGSLEVYQSVNGVDWDNFDDVFPVASYFNKYVLLKGRYVHVKYTNGESSSTRFALVSSLSRVSHTNNDSIEEKLNDVVNGLETVNNSITSEPMVEIKNAFSLESTQGMIKDKLDHLSFDEHDYLQVKVNESVSIGNFPSVQTVDGTVGVSGMIEVQDLSTLATESSLSSLNGKVVTCDTANIAGSVSVSNDYLVNRMFADFGTGWDSLKLDGSGNLKTAVQFPSSLDVNVTNSVDVSGSVAVSNTDSTPLFVRNNQLGAYKNACDNVTLLPSEPSSAFDVSNYAYIMGWYTDNFSGTGYEPIRLQYSFDGILWLNLFNTQLYPSSSGSGERYYSIYKQDIPGINFVRLLNTTTSTIPNINLTIMGSTI